MLLLNVWHPASRAAKENKQHALVSKNLSIILVKQNRQRGSRSFPAGFAACLLPTD